MRVTAAFALALVVCTVAVAAASPRFQAVKVLSDSEMSEYLTAPAGGAFAPWVGALPAGIAPENAPFVSAGPIDGAENYSRIQALELAGQRIKAGAAPPHVAEDLELAAAATAAAIPSTPLDATAPTVPIPAGPAEPLTNEPEVEVEADPLAGSQDPAAVDQPLVIPSQDPAADALAASQDPAADFQPAAPELQDPAAPAPGSEAETEVLNSVPAADAAQVSEDPLASLPNPLAAEESQDPAAEILPTPLPSVDGAAAAAAASQDPAAAEFQQGPQQHALGTSVELSQDEDSLRAQFKELSVEVAQLEDASAELPTKRARLIALARNIVAVTAANRPEPVNPVEPTSFMQHYSEAAPKAKAKKVKAPKKPKAPKAQKPKPSASANPPPSAVGVCPSNPDRENILSQLNSLRATAGTWPAGTPRGAALQISGALTRAAKQHVEAMIAEKTLKHYGDLSQLVSGWNNLGENIAYAYDGVQNMGAEWYSEVHNMLPLSDPNHFGHRANIMNPAFEFVGIYSQTGPAPFGGAGEVTYACTIFSNKATLPGSALKAQC